VFQVFLQLLNNDTQTAEGVFVVVIVLHGGKFSYFVIKCSVAYCTHCTQFIGLATTVRLCVS